MKILLLDYVHELAGAGYKPVSVPAYLEPRGPRMSLTGVVVKNGEGWPIIRLPSPDGWRDELTYWYRPGAEGPCRHCMAPAGTMILTVAPAYAVDIDTESQARDLAIAWKLARAPRVGRIMKYPYGRRLKGHADVGTLHPACMVERMTNRGWGTRAAEGQHTDAPVWIGLAEALTSDIRTVLRDSDDGAKRSTGRTPSGDTSVQTSLDGQRRTPQDARMAKRPPSEARKRSVRAISGTIAQTTLSK